jgi:hypothetical protein
MAEGGALCVVCASSAAAVYCRNDAALLCLKCDQKIHGINPLAARHWRVALCELCEREPATVYCRQARGLRIRCALRPWPPGARG